MNPLQAVHTNQAPKAVGAYSQAIQHQGMLYTSGQIGLDPQSGNMVADDVSSQAKQVVANLSAVIEAAGGQLNQIIKVTIFLENMDDFPAVNQIYAAWLGEHRPARSTVAVAALPLAAKVEMDCIVAVG
ncbi:MAG: Rid family detoxifying hydrolase [Ghiorsea sp.]|nr:Rid family detoxifying hydrolase [Ghiorsea sp.]MDQ7058721.1 Rid family detoxifying hydrolase [Ghiorsea sp.]